MAMMTANAASVTVESDSSVSHTYEIYQVMTGTVAGNQITAAKWGADVTAYNSAAVHEGDDVSSADLTIISGLTDAGLLPPTLTLKSTGREYADQSGAGNITFDNLEPGYYIVKDVTNLNNANDANSAWIVQVAGTASIDIKSAKPTFDKQVQDETGDAEADTASGWGDSADHAIGETFNFKLTATIPADADLKEYSAYALKFNDTLSNGITFGSISSVTVSSNKTGAVSRTITDANYSMDNNTKEAGGGSFALGIENIKNYIPEGSVLGEDVITVEVIYSATLNQNAVVDAASRTECTTSNSNNNTAFLNYSNNPDSTGAGTTQPGGKTPNDDVFVFTYEVDNTKYMINDTASNELGGAIFELQTSEGDQIPVIYDSSISAYRPLKSGETAGTEMDE